MQVSKDSKAWVTLRSHSDDTALSEPGSTATWELETLPDEKQVGTTLILLFTTVKLITN